MAKRRSGLLVAKNDPLIEEIISNPLYEIRPNGEIWTLICVTGKVSTKGVWRRAGRISRCKGVKNHKNSYWEISYKGKRLLAHRIIYRRFNGPLKKDLVVNHIDGNTLNNLPSNLELVSQSQNVKHTFASLGQKPLASRTKIDADIAAKIRIDHASGLSYRALAAKYGTSKYIVSSVITGRIWNSQDQIETESDTQFPTQEPLLLNSD